MYRLVDRLVICDKLIYSTNTSHKVDPKLWRYEIWLNMKYMKGQITERGSACVSLGKDERHCKTSIGSHQSHVFFIEEHAFIDVFAGKNWKVKSLGKYK